MPEEVIVFLQQWLPDIILGVLTLVAYFLVFLFKRLVKRTRENCVMTLKNKEASISSRDREMRDELERIKEENAELKAELTRIKNAILHFSEVNYDTENTASE